MEMVMGSHALAKLQCAFLLFLPDPVSAEVRTLRGFIKGPPLFKTQSPTRIRVEETAQRARRIAHTPPQYPPEARKAGIQGQVRLQIIVDERGHVAQIEVLEGHPLLVQAAITAERSARYQPTVREGHAVQVMATSSYHFTLPADALTGGENRDPRPQGQKPITTADMLNEFNQMCKELELLEKQKQITYWDRMNFCQRYSATGNFALVIGSSDAALRARLEKARAEFREFKRKAGLDPDRPIPNPHELKQPSKVLMQARVANSPTGVLRTLRVTDVDYGFVPGERTSLSHFSGVVTQRFGAGPPVCVLIYKEGGARSNLTSFRSASPSETLQLCSVFQRAIQEFNERYFPSAPNSPGGQTGKSGDEYAAPGVYLEISVCHACAYEDWQAKLLRELHSSRWSAFIGELNYDPAKNRIRPVRKALKAPD
jgi:TonB family protein